LDEALLRKLELWLQEADDWHVEGKLDLSLREHEPERRQLLSEVAPSEGNGEVGRQASRNVVSPRKRTETPSWPSDRLAQQMAMSRKLPEEGEPDGKA